MKIFKIKTLSTAQFDRLIERYYEGSTTCEEEKMLHKFLQQSDLSEKYHAEKAIFSYLHQTSKAKTVTLHTAVKWASVAAAMATILVLSPYLWEQKSNFAYIDGKKITDITQVQKQALASLGKVIENNADIVNQQLTDFSE